MTGFCWTCICRKTIKILRNPTKHQVSGLGTIKIGTAVKNCAGWYRYHWKWCVFHALYDQQHEDNSWLDLAELVFFATLIYLLRSQQKTRVQALGPSKSEPPSKSMSGGTGIRPNDVFVMPCMAKHVKISHKWLYQALSFPQPLPAFADLVCSGLGTIKIGTTIKNYVGWYRYHGKRLVFHVTCE